MRRIELKRAKRYMDTRSGKMFVKGKMYTVGDALGKRLLDQVDASDDPYFRDHGEISKAQVQKMLKEQQAKVEAEEKAKRQSEIDDLDSVILGDDDPVDSAEEAETSDADEHIAEVG